MDIEKIIFCVVIAFVMLYVLLFIISVIAALRFPMYRRDINLVEKREGFQPRPDELNKFNTILSRLNTLGFIHAYWFKTRPIHRNESPNTLKCVLFNTRHKAYALLTSTPVPKPGTLCLVEFSNYYDQKPDISTFNCHLHHTLPAPENVEVDDPYVGTLEEHWHYHINRINSIEQSALTLDDKQLCERENVSYNDYLQAGVRNRLLREKKDAYYLSLPAAITLVKNIWLGERRVRRVYAKPTAGTKSEVSDNIEDAVAGYSDSYFENKELMERKSALSGLVKTVIFLVTMGLFALAFGFLFDTESVAVVIGVLLFHELGHFAAMKAFGYRNLQIFFIPFFGAAIIGKPDRIPAWKQAVIYLAGPVPGILMAFVMMIFLGREANYFLIQLVNMLLIINYFNLLPIHPLDGGQLSSLLLFERWPKSVLLFHIASALAFFIVGYQLDEVIIIALGVLQLVIAYPQYRNNVVLHKVRDSVTEEDLDDERILVKKTFLAIENAGYSKWLLGNKIMTVKGILLKLRYAKPRASETVVGLMVYLVLLLPAIAIIIFLLNGQL